MTLDALFGDPASPGLRSAPRRGWSNRERLEEVGRYDLAGSRAGALLDRVARQTASRLHAPIALVTVVRDFEQQIVGSSGLHGWLSQCGGTPLEWSFCAQTVATGLPYIVNDATDDPGQRNNPLVLFDGVTSYAGVPLIASTGYILGAHCVIDFHPRIFTDVDIQTLRTAAEEIRAVLDECRQV